MSNDIVSLGQSVEALTEQASQPGQAISEHRNSLARRLVAGTAVAALVGVLGLATTTDLVGTRPQNLTEAEQGDLAEAKFLESYNAATPIGKFRMLFVTGLKVEVPTHTPGMGVNVLRNVIPHTRTRLLGGTCLSAGIYYDVENPKSYPGSSNPDEVFVFRTSLGAQLEPNLPPELQIEGLVDAEKAEDIQPWGFNEDTEEILADAGCWRWNRNQVDADAPETQTA